MKSTKSKSVKTATPASEADKLAAFEQLKKTIKKNLPKDYEEGIQFGMTSFYVPHSIYPDGYHCQPKVALPFISLAMQKNFIAVYHMGIYASPTLLDWFVKEYEKTATSKLDMGKSCIRFKKPDQIPFDLMAKLAGKISVQEWIDLYEKNYKKKK